MKLQPEVNCVRLWVVVVEEVVEVGEVGDLRKRRGSERDMMLQLKS